MNDRINQIRRKEGMSQRKFADRIGVSENYVWMMEKGDRVPSDRTIADICREFGISEEWLRTGNGEMYKPKGRNQILAEFFADVLDAKDGDPVREYCTVLASLSPEQLHQLAEISRAMMAHWKALQENKDKKEEADP